MKKILQNTIAASTMLIILTTILAFQMKNAPITATQLKDAVTQKKASVSFKSNGTYNGATVVLDVTNLGGSELKLLIPAGTLFAPSEESEQTLITVEDQYISLAPKAKANKTIEAFCSQASDACPKSTSTFTMNQTKDAKFQQLFTYMKGKSITKSMYQDIVWAISDNHDVSYLPNDTPAAKDLRKYLCALTGQKETWYSSPQTRTVDVNGNINSETVDIRGNINFICTKNMEVRQEVVNNTGEILMKGSAHAALTSGEVKSTFHIRVQGWKRGEYVLNIMSGTEILAKYAFTV